MGRLRQNMRRMSRFNEGVSGMSESSCLAMRRIGGFGYDRSSADNRDTESSRRRSHEVETTSTSGIGSPYIAIDTVKVSPHYHQLVWQANQIRQRRGKGRSMCICTHIDGKLDLFTSIRNDSRNERVGVFSSQVQLVCFHSIPEASVEVTMLVLEVRQ